MRVMSVRVRVRVMSVQVVKVWVMSVRLVKVMSVRVV